MKMTVSYEWLCDLVSGLNHNSPEDIGLALTAIGAETEHVSHICYGKHVELAEIISIEPLEKNSLITVKTSEKTYKTISNSQQLHIGHFVIIASVGVKLFGGFIVESKEIDGIKTEGMLVALQHLGIESKSNDIILLGNNHALAKSYFDVYTELDAIYTLDVPGNRADWLSVRGLAKALSIYFHLPLKELAPTAHSENKEQDISLSIESNRCARYSIRKISNIDNTISSPIVQKRLILLGMRPIDKIVDLTNMVMLETGQPTHAFDADKITGPIIVRQAKLGERLTLLDKTEVILSEDDLIICDNDKILALAGIMGGIDSGVTSSTTSIYLESASFNGVWIRRSAKRLGLKTESSLRFEKNISPELVPNAANTIISLLPNSTISFFQELYPHPLVKHDILCTPDEIRKYLGVHNIDDAVIADIITKIGCEIHSQSHHWRIIPSGERLDLKIKEDIMEEVARFYGYNKITPTVYRPSGVNLNPNKSFDEIIRPILRGMGIHEAVTIAFRSPELREFYKITNCTPVTIVNPLNSEWTELRTHLFDGLLAVVKHNSSKAFEKNISFSEIASVFSKQNDEFIEEKKLCFIISNQNSPYKKALNILQNILTYSKLQNIQTQRISSEKYEFLHPLNAFEILYDNKIIGFFGEIHPELAEDSDLSDKKDFPAPVVCEILFDVLKNSGEQKFVVEPINELPPILRDITITVDRSFLTQNIISELKSMHPALKEISFISAFENEKLIQSNKKNISLKLRFESEEILKSEEIDTFIKNILEKYHI